MQWSFQLWKTTIGESCQWNEKQTKWIIMINFESKPFQCTSNSKQIYTFTESCSQLHSIPPKGPDKSEAIYGQVCEDSHS